MKLPIPGSKILSPGVALELLVPLRAGPKYKFCVFCSDDDPPMYFLINSNIDKYIAQKPYLLEQQVALPRTELDHRLHKNCYLDCSQIFENFTRQQVCDLIDQNPGCYMGRLSDGVLREVAKVVSASMTIRPVEMQIILSGLAEVLPAAADNLNLLPDAI